MVEISSQPGSAAGTPAARQIRVPDYADDQGTQRDIEEFRKDVARGLGANPDQVVLKETDGTWTASVPGKPDKTGTLAFEDSKDELRLRQLARSSRSPVLVDFGKAPAGRAIRIGTLQQPPPADPKAPKVPEEKLKAERLERFKAQVLFQLQSCPHEVQLLKDEGGLVALAPGSDERVDILFTDPVDQKEFVALAEASKVPELLYLGEPMGRVLRQPPLEPGLRDEALAQEFITRLAVQLGTHPDNVEIHLQGGRLMAFERHHEAFNVKLQDLSLGGDGRIDVLFEQPHDYERIIALVPNSKSPVLSNFGRPPSEHQIHIPAYNPNDGRDKNIKRFQDDVAREMGEALANIEIKYEGGMLEAYKVGSTRPVDIIFADSRDFSFFVKEAVTSKSSYLAYFGQKRTNTRAEIAVGTGWPNPQAKTNFSETITNETFIGNSGLNKFKTSVTASEPFNSPFFQRDNIKNVTFGYHNLNWGGGDVVFNGKSFSIAGLESTFLTNHSNAFKNSYVNRLKQGDGEAILTGIGTLALVGAAAYGFSELWPTAQTLDLPLMTKVYDKGALQVNAGSSQSLILGNHQREFDWKGASLEVKENIASGVSSSQSASYDPKKEQLGANAAFTWERFNVAAANSFDLHIGQRTNTHLSTGYSYDLAPKWVMGWSYAQDIDQQGYAANPNLGNNITYTPNASWLFNLNTNVSAPKYGEPASYGLGIKTGIQF